MDAKRSHARLELPTAFPAKMDRWAHEKLTDPRAEQLLEKMTVDLKESLTLRLAPLLAHSRPLWSLKGAEDNLGLHPNDLSNKELRKAVRTLLEKDQGGPQKPISHCTAMTMGRR